MDTNKTYLEQALVSYRILILLLVIFTIIMVLLFVKSYSGFNKYFGYQIFITGPFLLLIAFLIKELLAYKNNQFSSIFSKVFTSQTQGVAILGASIVSLFILAFFLMLYVGGIFSDNPPENNVSTIINFVIIVLFVVISLSIYKNSKEKDDATLKNLPREIQEIFALRTRYTMLFVLFIFLITILYFWNPYGIMTNYGGPVVFFTLFVGIIMVIMITIYQYLLANPSKVATDTPSMLSFVTKAFYILASIGISFGLIYATLKMMGIFDTNNMDSWGHIIFNLVLFSAMLGIIYKLINAGGFLDKNPFYRLILNTILYIPCLLVNVFAKVDTGSPTKPHEYKILVGSLILLLAYFAWIFYIKHFIQSKYLTQGGLQLVNQPISTDKLTNVATYQKLSGSDKLKYQYCISFWCYLDAFSKNSGNKKTSLVSYGGNPSVNYDAEHNTIYITIKNNVDKKELNIDEIKEWKKKQSESDNNIVEIEQVKLLPLGKISDEEGNRIIYKHPDVLLQKWNHILLNYNGGTLDVFYNGRLVKSAIEVVPYMYLDMLTVGEENGISGNVANLMYFKEPLDILTINTLYNSLKDSNPPVIPENSKTIIE